MAIIRGVRKILKSDLTGAPGWFTPVIGILNAFLDTVISGLRGKLTFSDNFYVDIKTLTFEHGVEKSIFYDGVISYQGLLLLKSADSSDINLVVLGYTARVIGPNTIGITVLFNGGASTENALTFGILG